MLTVNCLAIVTWRLFINTEVTILRPHIFKYYSSYWYLTYATFKQLPFLNFYAHAFETPQSN